MLNKDLIFKFVHLHRSVLIVFLILISALIIRLYNLNKYDLWFDEISSCEYSHKSLENTAAWSGVPVSSVISEKLQNDPHPSLFYLLIYFFSFLLKGWKSLRLISVVFSTLSLLVFYKLARLIYNRSTSILALLLMAVSPFQVWYAQEVRVYAISLFFSLLAALFFIKILIKEKQIYWFLFFISEVAALFTDYCSFLLLIIALIFLLSSRNFKYAGKVSLFIAVVIVSCLPFLGVILHHLSIVMKLFWLLPPVLGNLFLSFIVFGLGYSADAAQSKIGSNILAVLFIYGIYRSFKDKNKYTIFILSSFLLPIIIIFTISKLIIPLYIDRQFIVLTPFYYLLIANGISSIKNIKLKSSVCFVLVALMASSLINYNNGFILLSKTGKEIYPGVHGKKQYKVLLTYLYDNVDREDIIAMTDTQSYILASSIMWRKFRSVSSPVFLFYPGTLNKLEKNVLFSKLLSLDGRLKGNGMVDKISMHGLYFRHGYPVVLNNPLSNATGKRVWLITSFWDKAGTNPGNNNYHRIKAQLLEYYKEEESIEKDGIILERFMKKDSF